MDHNEVLQFLLRVVTKTEFCENHDAEFCEKCSVLSPKYEKYFNAYELQYFMTIGYKLALSSNPTGKFFDRKRLSELVHQLYYHSSTRKAPPYKLSAELWDKANRDTPIFRIEEIDLDQVFAGEQLIYGTAEFDAELEHLEIKYLGRIYQQSSSDDDDLLGFGKF